MEKIFIVSDLHLGLPQFRRSLFKEFLDNLPSNAVLVLNGDTIDAPSRNLPEGDLAVLEKLAAMSINGIKKIVWLEGNHDEAYRPPVQGKIQFEKFYVFSEYEAMVTHGAFFDNVMPHNKWFLWLFKRLHNFRVKLGSPPVHVAEYAKKWRLLYDYLQKTVRRNAIQHSRENGYRTIVCGHLHCAEKYEDSTGVCYVNTGAWTEFPPSYAVLTSQKNCALYQYTGGPLNLKNA